MTTGGCIYDPELSESLKNAYNMGHQIASHTWHHWNLTTLNWDQSKCPSYGFFSDQHPDPTSPVHDEMWQVERAFFIY